MLKSGNTYMLQNPTEDTLTYVAPLTLWDIVSEAGYNPFHAYQLTDSTQYPVSAQCPTVLFDRSWQAADRVGRYDVAHASLYAEWQARHYLSYVPSLAIVNVTHTTNRLSPALALPLRNTRAVGTIAYVQDAAPVAVTYTASPTATVDVTVTALEDTRHIFLSHTDANAVGTYAYKLALRPILRQRISPTLVRFTFHVAPLALPQPMAPLAALPYGNSSAYAQELKVSRIVITGVNTIDINGSRVPITVRNDAIHIDDCTCLPALVDCNTQFIIRFDYLTGQSYSPDGHYVPGWKSTMAGLALANTHKPVCACATANRYVGEMQQDIFTGGEENSFIVNSELADNALGTRRGHVYAWSRFLAAQRQRSFSI